MKTRSGKVYNEKNTLKTQIETLKKELNKKIDYNLKHGIYGQTAYNDDYTLIEFLEDIDKDK